MRETKKGDLFRSKDTDICWRVVRVNKFFIDSYYIRGDRRKRLRDKKDVMDAVFNMSYELLEETQ